MDITLPMVTPTKDNTAKGNDVSMDVDEDASGEEAMTNAMEEIDKEMADMIIDDNPMG